jgi:dihydrofolate reductase
MDENRLIGCGNRLPWRVPADLRHFRRLTLDKPILMGRRTWESLPGLLPRRRHILLTRNTDYRAPGCEIVFSPESALRAAADASEILVIGGGELYRAMWGYAKCLYLTLIHATFDGDTWFPDWNGAQWREIEREEHTADEENPHSYAFVTLERADGLAIAVNHATVPVHPSREAGSL